MHTILLDYPYYFTGLSILFYWIIPTILLDY